MRTIGQLTIPKETDLDKFPDSTIVNETDVNDGTPVVREIYGDILTNMYKLLRIAKITPSNTEDNELNGYQLIDALKKFSNSMNDVEQQLSFSGTVLSINLDLSILPNRYVCFSRAVDNTTSGTVYTFKGSGSEVYTFEANSLIASGDLVLLVIDSSKVRAYVIDKEDTVDSLAEIFTPFGSPVAYNDSGLVYYQDEGILFSDTPNTFDLQSSIRFLESDGTMLVYEMLVISGFVYCLTYKPSATSYKIYRFSLTAMSIPILVSVVGTDFPVGSDNRPNIYTDGTNFYITNGTGNSASDFLVNIYLIDHSSGVITSSGSITLDISFLKTTNAVIKNNSIYTYVGGVLNKYNLGTGALTHVNTFSTFIGLIFQFKGNVYYSNGEVAKKWTLV